MFFDYLIIGQGLAGSLLSYHLHLRNKSALVVDQPFPFSASKQAAGLYSPVTGKNLVFTWKAHHLFPYLIKVYSDLEVMLKEKFLHSSPMYKPFLNYQELNDWQGKAILPESRYFVEKVLPANLVDARIIDPYGGLLLKNTGYLDVPKFLNAYRKWLTKKELLEEGYVNADDLELRKDYIQYHRYKVGKVILCTGISPLLNIFFPNVRLIPLRGEIVSAELQFNPKQIINRGIFILPQQDGTCRIGSTYENNRTELACQPKIRKQFAEKIRRLYRSEFVLREQQVGLRPTTHDRRPVLGIHPDLKLLGIFNGLGTKGVSLAPFFADQLVKYLEDGEEFAIETNISRYF